MPNCIQCGNRKGTYPAEKPILCSRQECRRAWTLEIATDYQICPRCHRWYRQTHINYGTCEDCDFAAHFGKD